MQPNFQVGDVVEFALWCNCDKCKEEDVNAHWWPGVIEDIVDRTPPSSNVYYKIFIVAQPIKYDKKYTYRTGDEWLRLLNEGQNDS